MKVGGSSNSPQLKRKGVALVVVLSCLLLVCGLVLSFFLSISTETKASRQADSGGRSRDLVDTATNIVMAQIRAGTTQGSKIAWASQPGMIRTYGGPNNNPDSVPLRYYKLFSAEKMVLNAAESAAYTQLEDRDMAWSAKPSLYTDLNQPVRNLQGVDQYPIVDPTALTLPNNQKPVGFSITAAPLSTNNPTGATLNQAPMPVRWLYVLQDGTISSPDREEGGKAVWNVGDPNIPTKANPIAGRIAFWADDDSAKVNINTAAGDIWSNSEPGSYWAPPQTGTTFDKQALANFQPAQGEYQRYPGHPATTYLSAVIPDLSREQIGLISSRIATGGSRGGTVIAGAPVTVDGDRLYASIDELVYNPLRTEQSGITNEVLDRSRFFITAHSRSPEVNLFNKPRISIWPIHKTNNAEYRTAFDRLIAFCSTMGLARDYFFTRENSRSPTQDFQGSTRNQLLYEYLQDMTEQDIPGFGRTFLEKYGPDRDQILTQIFDYIRCTNLYDDTLHPAGTYPANNKQFAGRRSSATGMDAGFGQVTPIKIGDTSGFGRFYTISEASLVLICTADGSGDPTIENNAQNTIKLNSNKLENRTLTSVLGKNEKRIEATVLIELFTPSRGAVSIRPDMKIKIRGLDQIRVIDSALKPQLLGLPAEGVISMNVAGSSLYHGRAWGGTAGFRLPLVASSGARRLPARGSMTQDSGWNAANSWPFTGSPITIRDGNLRLIGTNQVFVEIYSGANAEMTPDNLIQVIQLNFPSATTGPAGLIGIPAPNLVLTGTDDAPNSSAGTTSSPATTPENWWSFSYDGAFQNKNGRIAQANRNPGENTTKPFGGSIIRQEDVVRSILPVHSDFRLIAASSNVPAYVFESHPNYLSNTLKLAHSLTETIGPNYIQGGDLGGKILEGASYSGNMAPDVPSQQAGITKATKVATASGDWDTGIANYPDGPYINKPDEGNNVRKNYDGSAGAIPYYDRNEQQEESGPTFFSPNRIVSSAVMFGSLPSGVKANIPWRTLLFRPDTNGGGSHMGTLAPKDHLLLDLFWMPVVEPYAISEPFSTAGKINMNYQMVPFNYIERSTGLHALFKSERVIAIPKADANKYKGSAPATYRFPIDAEETLKQFKERFDDQNDLFRSASELCELYLVPEGQTVNGMPAYWNNNSLTGDNLKERPYSTLYPRLTTKSNTFTVHYKVQVLKQATRSRGDDATTWATWDEATDQFLSESRGSTTVERYIDPASMTMPDFAALIESSTETVNDYYRFRVVNSKRFAP